MQKPIILFDFDGVFNILDKPDGAQKRWDELVTVTIPYDGHPKEDEFRVMVGKTLIDFLTRLAASELVDIRWLTTWVDNTEKFPHWLGMPVLPWMARPEVESEWDWWKQKAVKKLVEEVGSEVPILWVDDDHGYDPSTAHWLFTSQFQIHPLAPESISGLLPLDVETISFFVKKHTGVDIQLTED